MIIEQFYLHSMPDRAEVAKNMIIDLCSRAVDYYPDVGNVIIGPECISPSATFQFFRSAGFRRIGASKWLATSIDKDHPAKLIDEQDDLDPFPALPTELEKLETSLEQRRTRGRKDGKRVEISDEFRGHSTTNIKKLLELRNLSVQDADAFRRARFGCTCGSCIGGYISPRMAYTLTKTAQRIFHALVQITECHDNRKKFQAAIISGQDFHGRDVKDTLAYNTWKYLPDPCRERILVVQDEARGHYEVSGNLIYHDHNSRLTRYLKIFAAIFNTLLLRAVPDRQQIVRGFKLSTMVDAGLDNYCQTQQLPSPHVRPRHVFEAYESGGGTLEPVFNRLFDLSLFQDEKAGNNTFQLDAQYAQEYPALPRCRNDSEYGFVKGMLLQ